MKTLLAAVSGMLFGIGLLISGMTRPEKVIGFLDVTRDWDPTLAFVMAGAVGVYAIAFRLIRGRGAPWFDTRFDLPAKTDIDRTLILGSAIFGIGWGLVGLCPGPALVVAASGSIPALAFVAAMLAGMYAEQRVTR